jgi:hypothetical protein
MRKRKHVVGLTLALAASVAVASVAHGAVTGQTVTTTITPAKQDKKAAGPISLETTIATQTTPGTPVAQTASLNEFHLDKDISVNAGTLKTCNPSALVGTTTDAAKSTACPGTQVGQGDANLCSAAAGCGAGPGVVPAVVTAFNGVKSGGNPVLLLHTKPGGIAAATPPSILTGTLVASNIGGLYGRMLSTIVPDTAATGLHLTNFHVVLNKIKTGTGKAASVSKKKKKAKKKPIYYLSAKCSGNKVWDFRESTYYRAGGTTQTATDTQPCVQKKKKKKKK